ncbi:hypothetical protein ES702_05114 [subsurface metagenome]
MAEIEEKKRLGLPIADSLVPSHMRILLLRIRNGEKLLHGERVEAIDYLHSVGMNSQQIIETFEKG